MHIYSFVEDEKGCTLVYNLLRASLLAPLLYRGKVCIKYNFSEYNIFMNFHKVNRISLFICFSLKFLSLCFGAFLASDGLVAIWWLTTICRDLTSCFLTWSKCCDCVLNSEWIPSIPCSLWNPRPMCHCLRNGQIWSSSMWNFGVIAMPERFCLHLEKVNET